MKKAISILVAGFLIASSVSLPAVNADETAIISESSEVNIINENSKKYQIRISDNDNKIYFGKETELVWVFTNDKFSDSFTEDQYIFTPEKNGKYLVMVTTLTDDKVMTGYIVNSVNGKIKVVKNGEYELKRDDVNPEQMRLQQTPVFSAANNIINTNYYFQYVNARNLLLDYYPVRFVINSESADSSLTFEPKNDFYYDKIQTVKTADDKEIPVYSYIVSVHKYSPDDVSISYVSDYPDGEVEFHMIENEKNTVYKLNYSDNDIVPSSLKISTSITTSDFNLKGDANCDGELIIPETKNGTTVFSAEEYEEEILTYFYYENVDAQLLYDKELDSFHITFKSKKDYEDFIEYFVRTKNYATLSKVTFQYPPEKSIKAIYGEIETVERHEDLEISEDGKTLLNYPSNQTEEVFVIPDGIEVIGSCAFASATNLKKVVFPETVKVIEKMAFWGCNFETIDFLPDSLEKICDGAFAYDESLKAVTIPKNVTELEYMFFGPFGYCINLEEVTFERENPKMHQSADSTHSPDDKEYFDTFYEGSVYGLGADLGHLVYYFPDNSFDIYAGTLSYDNREFYKISMKDYKPSFSPQKQDVTGDANCDGELSMADAVLIMQSIANPAKFGIEGTDVNHITEQGKKNADIAGENDGITNADALAIQKYKLSLITSLPEKK